MHTYPKEYGLNILSKTEFFFFKSKDGELKIFDAKINSFDAESKLQWFAIFLPWKSSSPITSGQDDVTLIHSELQQGPRARRENV